MPVIISGISLPFTEPPESAIEQAKKLAKLPIRSAVIAKRSVDARHKNDIRFVYSVSLEINGSESEVAKRVPNARLAGNTESVTIPQTTKKDAGLSRPVVAGFGPAGMFASLYLARAGLRPVILERGAAVDERVHDVEAFFNGGSLNSESNVQFGEGGAGTFSDGKLTTRTNDPRCAFVLNELVRHGAPESILLEAKPHIGTDLLRGIVKKMRGEIISLGGEILFNTRLDGIVAQNGRLKAVRTSNGEMKAEALVLAVGHSARDTFEMLAKHGVLLESKPFSVGVRIEHPQSEIDAALYGRFAGHPLLPKAEYQLSLREKDRAVYTFCMCPGGLVVPAASKHGGIVTNGMSAYARDLENANSALVVSVSSDDFGADALAGVQFQRQLEHAAFKQAGKTYRAPVQDVGSFLDGKAGFKLGKVAPSYTIGINHGEFDKLFPNYVVKMLRTGLRAFDRRQAGFACRDAVLTGVETRTSSPVRIPRGESLEAEGISGLYPCGEGAGYAGGIMSAAVDGLRCAESLAHGSK